jgi:hypothetical protein
MQGDHVAGLPCGVPDQRKSSARGNDLTVWADESLGVFVRVIFTAGELSVALRAGVALVRVNNVIPAVEKA